ncbi:MAG: hypothetical protein I3273_02435 [Candidatus Moeniiplasma glomeromycotorum]|nr:hypothetical protein [Candidatus Moeniiplasma glomeromycotorum]MCE8167025.1 hypothetical protein [Candidatus Moeniiplasma glomeromycotorum]MCE8168963.1 hypothetical protein [Candidatus Moeniiplasma glomeromycotorum]
MATQQKRRISRKYYGFFLACLASLVGLLVYILARYKIPFPHQWLPNIKNSNAGATRLFFAGISIHLQVNFALGMAFMVLNPEKIDRIKFQKWKFWITRALIFIFSLGWGLIKYWNDAKPEVTGGWGSILLLSLILVVINCCLLELLIQLMNQYGICNAFNIILFTEFLPLRWLATIWREGEWGILALGIFLLFLLTILFVWLTNLKWEAPVETNTLYSQERESFVKSRSTLGFKLNLSFMPWIYLSWLISSIYSLVLMRNRGTDWTSPGDISTSWTEANQEKITSSQDLTSSKHSFFKLNENKHIFYWENLVGWIKENKWIIIGALLFLIFLRWLAVWLEMSQRQWNSKEISKDLRQRGIYLNYLPPGKNTRLLLKKIVNKLVLFWNFLILIFNIIFDNIFVRLFGKGTELAFLGWFGGVNIGVELIRQIRTRYKYIRN